MRAWLLCGGCAIAASSPATADSVKSLRELPTGIAPVVEKGAKTRSVYLPGTIAAAGAARAAPLSVTIDARHSSDPVTKYEYGMFIEPIGGLIARTLWAEMLDDRKFYYPIVPEGKDPPP